MSCSSVNIRTTAYSYYSINLLYYKDTVIVVLTAVINIITIITTDGVSTIKVLLISPPLA